MGLTAKDLKGYLQDVVEPQIFAQLTPDRIAMLDGMARELNNPKRSDPAKGNSR